MQALSGIVALDMCRGYPGALATMYLGDFGADVIRIDPPSSELSEPPGMPDDGTERFAAYHAKRRNKRSIVINLKTEEGRNTFYRLAGQADVIVEGFRPGVMAKLGADYSILKELNRRVIYCSLTGYGHDGPLSALPGHDTNYCGLGGILSLIGTRDGPPQKAGNFLADYAGAAHHAIIGILLALCARERTGQGQFVDVTYLDGVISLLAGQATSLFAFGQVPRRGEGVVNGSTAWSNLYRCKDGEYFSVFCAEPHFWENLCRTLGRDDLIPTQTLPLKEQEWVIAELADIFLIRTRDDWFDFLKDKDVCVAPVYHLDETFAHPQVVHRQMVVDIEHEKFGRVRQIGIPIKLSDTPGHIGRLGTLVGAHTDEVLIELGYTRQEVKDLRRAKAVE